MSEHLHASIQRYAWHGQNRAGQALSGVLYGEDKNAVREQLEQRGIIAKHIECRHEPWRKPVPQREVTKFLQELGVLYEAGVPLLRILDVLLHSQKNRYFYAVIQTMRLDIERGEFLYRALRHHPQVFDDLTCNLVESGEMAGRLADVLRNIVYTQERRQQLITQVRTALSYPLFVVGIALLVWMAVLGWVVPVFEGVYRSNGQALPWLTQLLVDVSRLVRTNGLWLVALFVLCIVFLLRWKNARWLYFIDCLKLKLPVFGSLLRTAWHAQFARTLALLYQSGVPLHHSLSTASRSVPHRPMQHAIDDCTQHVLNGHSLSSSMTQYAIFETALIQRIQIGEESGMLTDMLMQHATHNEFLVEQTIKRLSVLIEPILIVLIGLMVGVMVVALYWPILNLGTVVR
ncbi:type II secretion system F family protein [Hydromonas duriensis]|uniref:Type IV pilus assembly protein PilC n=1 Tax=Hydromonas duriensis TaxID=1527608 RepID=A0A4V6PY22_9BURK|nr:type II secretion system F family protein [Hydromonas duriensis]TDR28811.1 type IV pilus assembly protein PilC [Hydromonas duriensis]